jgi:tRNA/rRNA methyltransferase
MNLGQAVAVCLWELAREATAPALQAEPRAGSGDIERLGALLLEVLEVSGYTHPMAAGSTTAEVQRMLRRLHVTDADTHLLMGMMRKVLWKLRSSGKDAG